VPLQAAISILDPHFPLEQAPELWRSEVHIPYSIIDLLQAGL